MREHRPFDRPAQRQMFSATATMGRAGEVIRQSIGATALVKLKKLDLALIGFDAAQQANPRYASSLYGRGIAKRLKGDEAGASADIAAAKQISPEIAEDFERYGVPVQ
jgi:hypothetical protein